MKLLIFEPDHLGHHLAYLRLLLAAASELPLQVVAAVNSAALDGDEARANLQSLPNSIRWDCSIPSRSGSKRQTPAERAAHLLRLIEEHRPEHVWIPHLDGLALALGSFFGKRRWPCEIQGLLMHGGFAYPGLPLKKQWAWQMERMRLRSMNLHTLFVLDAIVFDYLRQRAAASELELMPDPIDPPLGIGALAARRLLGIPEEGRYIGCVGYADRRKGCDLLIRAFAAARLGGNDRLLFVGRMSPTVARLAGPEIQTLKAAGRLIHIDGYVDSQRFLAGLEALDVVVTPYPQHVGSSSIVIRAAAAGRYVLGAEYGWVGDAIRRFGLGQTTQVRSIPKLAQAIADSLEAFPSHHLGESAARFVNFHSAANFAATWTSRLRHRLQMPPSPLAVAWDTVIA